MFNAYGMVVNQVQGDLILIVYKLLKVHAGFKAPKRESDIYGKNKSSWAAA